MTVPISNEIIPLSIDNELEGESPNSKLKAIQERKPNPTVRFYKENVQSIHLYFFMVHISGLYLIHINTSPDLLDSNKSLLSSTPTQERF